MPSWLLCLPSDQVVCHLTRETVFCSWARHLTINNHVALSSLMRISGYWQNLMQGYPCNGLVSHSPGGSICRNTPCSCMLQKQDIGPGLTHMQTFLQSDQACFILRIHKFQHICQVAIGLQLWAYLSTSR